MKNKNDVIERAVTFAEEIDSQLLEFIFLVDKIEEKMNDIVEEAKTFLWKNVAALNEFTKELVAAQDVASEDERSTK